MFPVFDGCTNVHTLYLLIFHISCGSSLEDFLQRVSLFIYTKPLLISIFISIFVTVFPFRLFRTGFLKGGVFLFNNAHFFRFEAHPRVFEVDRLKVFRLILALALALALRTGVVGIESTIAVAVSRISTLCFIFVTIFYQNNRLPHVDGVTGIGWERTSVAIRERVLLRIRIYTASHSGEI